VFARAREKARQASCESNLKQLELSLLMYAQDYDEVNIVNRIATSNPATPTGPYATAYCGTVYWWKDMVAPYVKNDQVFICPSDPLNTACGVPVYRSYQPNVEMDGVKDSAVGDPAGTIHLIESNYNTRADYWDPGSYNMPGNSAARHNEGWNIAFVDGHVKWMKSDAEYNGIQCLALSHWTPAAD